ncbi:MAG: MBL fold metallo-hydrolase [Clostridia bacterium]|nr:MBL fold metallo-hydrolase [Clostridia bacterium]
MRKTNNGKRRRNPAPYPAWEPGAGRDPGRIVKYVVPAICILTVLALFLSSEYRARYGTPTPGADTLSVMFIDVGQGDSELILCGGHSVLIDGGEAACGAKLVSMLRGLGVKKIDCVVATHPHADHIGGLIDVLENVAVGELLMPALTENNIPTTRVYERFLEAAAASGAKAVRAAPGDEYAYGEIRFTVLSPLFAEAADLNDMSVVLRMKYGGVSFLFTGDAGVEAENAMLETGADLSSDVLKVGHHGSRSAKSAAFYRAVSPRIAVVECGDGTEYHPHKETVGALVSIGAQVYRTDRDGTVVVTTDGSRISVTKEK